MILLTYIFETFRSTCLQHYGFDVAHFYTAPGLAWQACLKYKGVELELPTNPYVLLMFEQEFRRGITQAVHRHTKVNNKWMGDQFSPKGECSHL